MEISGSRFSVIAEEIRKLSMNSKESMKEISLLINKILENINNFKDQIDHFGNDVNLAVDNFQQLHIVLNNVVQAFRNINIKISQLASSTEELSTASKEIARNVEMNLNETEKILHLSENTSNSAKDLLEILDELRNTTMNIKTKSYNNYIFDLAITDHEIYLNKIEEFIQDKINLSKEEISEYTKCRFGKWYYSDDSLQFRDKIEFRLIEEPHKKVHELAKKIYELKNQNQLKETEEYYQEILKESQKIMELLIQLKTSI
ncbi:MAG: hypothetical protein KatS3mg129_1536 [Leptospiraceae bacterium]|nr:MAG: hypothetical protein KatS3mg129_1536 [Leptospiraceae bacterium]